MLQGSRPLASARVQRCRAECLTVTAPMFACDAPSSPHDSMHHRRISTARAGAKSSRASKKGFGSEIGAAAAAASARLCSSTRLALRAAARARLC